MTRRPSDPQGEYTGKSGGSIGRKARFLGACLLPAIVIGSLVTLAARHARASSVVVSPVSTDAAARPPMGWNDWYEDRCGVTESDILTSARRLVSTGLADDGYNTVVIDDCWMASAR